MMDGKVAFSYGACCALIVCAILLLMAVGDQGPLGFGISVLFLAVFWSGVPLLLLSVCSLRGRRIIRAAGIAALLFSLAPAAICVFYPLVTMLFSDANSSFGAVFSIAFLGGSVGILAGMLVFRHKTRHASFKFGIPVIIAVQLAVAFYLGYAALGWFQ